MIEINKTYNGEALEVLKTFPADCIDALVTDPPYGLSFMGKKWDYQVPSMEIWGGAYRAMKPGAHGLVACGTRTQHRMVCNIEDAGFEIRDVITWHYGTGFPKSLNCGNGTGTALKPATEFWTLIRKPISENTIALNIEKHGTGAINIDGSRIALNGEDQPSGSAKRVFSKNGFNQDNTKYGNNTTTPELGRFPANVIFDEFTASILDEQVGELISGKPVGIRKASNKIYGKYETGAEITGFGDRGGASRFFYCAKAGKGERSLGLDGFEKKQGGMRSETSGQHITRRDGGAPEPVANHHPTVKPLTLMRYLVRLITPLNGTVLDCFGGSGTTGVACAMEGFNYVLIEREKEYCDIAEARIKSVKQTSLAL